MAASRFINRLVDRVDKIDPESLQSHLLRLAQEHGFLETIFQSIQEGILVINMDGLLIYANRAAEGMVGLDFAKSKGRSVVRLLRSWEWEHLLEPRLDSEENWARVVTREIELAYPDHRYISVYAKPFKGAAEDGHGVLIILRDISRERNLEASVIESERINAVKNLAAGLAHEIGNPLNALNIHLQLLLRELDEVKDVAVRQSLQELATVARSEIERLHAINTQFLGAIRPQKAELKPEHPEQILQETLNVMRTEFENRRIHVSLESSERIPTVHLDAAQIKQVYFNVIKNALEAMPDGGALRIVFSVDDVFVDIAFIDTGCGIAPEELGRVFEPYHTTKQKGSGLGLMIVQRILEEHGGEIELSSKQGEGTSFRIRLPRSERRVRQLSASGTEAEDGAVVL